MATGLGNIAAFSLVTPLADLNKWNQGIANTARGFDRLNASAMNFKAILGGGILLGAAKNILTLSDNYQVLSRRIATASDSVADFDSNMNDLVSTSMQTGTALNTNVKLFQDLKRAGLGSSEEIRTLNKAVAQMGVLSGSTTEDMKYGLRQLSQGLSAGIFRAEEFNSVQENTPEIMKQIRIGLGKTQGQLRQMVLDGKLLSEDVFRVLVERADEVAAAFAKIPPDMARGIEATKTGLTVFFGKLDKGLGLTKSIAQAAFDFGNMLNSEEALNKALRFLAAFKVGAKFYIVDPYTEAFNILKSGFSGFGRDIQSSFDSLKTVSSDLMKFASNLNLVSGSAVALGTVILYKATLPIRLLGAAILTTGKNLAVFAAKTVVAASKALINLSLAAFAAMRGFLGLSVAILTNPIGLIITAIAAAILALGYFAGASSKSGSEFQKAFTGVHAVLNVIGRNIVRAYKDIEVNTVALVTSMQTIWDTYYDTSFWKERNSAFAYNFMRGFAGIEAAVTTAAKKMKLQWEIMSIKMDNDFTKLSRESVIALTEKIKELEAASAKLDITDSLFEASAAENYDKYLATWDARLGSIGPGIANAAKATAKWAGEVVKNTDFWKEISDEVKRLEKTVGTSGVMAWLEDLKVKLLGLGKIDFATEIEKELAKMKAKIKESPMKITGEDTIKNNFDEVGEQKASDFMKGYTDAFETFGKSTSQMMTDALFGDSSVSFREIARKLVKDLLTNTIHFLLVSPLVKSMQALMGSIFTLPDGTNPFDNLSNAANGVAATKKTPGQSAGGISTIIGGIGKLFGAFAGPAATGSSTGSFTSSFLQPSTAGLMQSAFSGGGMSEGTSQSFNNVFNIAANEPATFMEARGRIGNQITRTQRNS